MKLLAFLQMIVLTALTLPATALAQEKQFIAEPWQVAMREPATPVMERIFNFHNELLVLITVISIFVLVLMIWVCVAYRESKNPAPSKTTHNNLLEIAWTALPALILVVIGWVSWGHLYYMDDVETDAEMTLKVVGYQWYWNYEYPDHGGFSFDSYMVKERENAPDPQNFKRLLTVDNAVVVPVDTKVRVQITAGDVIHAWALPNMGIKTDAVPGLLNETWFRATQTGMFYGQCSELCGVGHGFMPINVRVVSKEAFAEWVEMAQERFAEGGNHPLHFADLRR